METGSFGSRTPVPGSPVPHTTGMRTDDPAPLLDVFVAVVGPDGQSELTVVVEVGV